MKKMKKLIAWILAGAICCGASVGATVAYLTDRDSEANVFTVGDVRIDLTEDFKQGAELIPGKVIEKEPTIKNVGLSEAWVWATVAIPTALDGGDDASKNVVHFNYDGDVVNDSQWTWKKEDGSWNYKAVEHDGIKYNVYTVLYQTPLKATEETPSIMTQVYMDTHMDIDPEGNWHWIVDGESAKGPIWNSSAKPMIYVSAYGIQSAGFNTVREAYAAYNTQWGEYGQEWGTPATMVTTEEELMTALLGDEEIVIGDDIVLDDDENVISKSAVIHLGEQTISSERNYIGPTATPTSEEISTFVVKGTDTKVVFDGVNNKGAVLNTGETGGYAIAIKEGAEVTIKEGVYVSYYHPLYVKEGTLIIEGGFFDSPSLDEMSSRSHISDGKECFNSYIINCHNDNYYIHKTVNVIVKGGTFVNLDPSSVHEGRTYPGDTAGCHQNFVAPGYKVEKQPQANGDVWYVVVPE